MLNPYAPTKDNVWINSIDHDHVYEIKFHGKSTRKFPLKNSNIEKIKEKNKIKKIFFSQYGPTINIANPKNNDKNKGIITREKGMKILNISSCVKDIDIQ